MKNKRLPIDIPLPKDSKPKWPKYLSIALSGVIVAGSLMIAGASIQKALEPERLPANENCINSNQAVKQAAKDFSAQLVAAIDGQDAPGPDLAKVKEASTKCRETVNQYNVTREAQK